MALGCTAKGQKDGCRQAHFIAAIAYGIDFICCKQYHGKRFLQDRCPGQIVVSSLLLSLLQNYDNNNEKPQPPSQVFVGRNKRRNWNNIQNLMGRGVERNGSKCTNQKEQKAEFAFCFKQQSAGRIQRDDI